MSNDGYDIYRNNKMVSRIKEMLKRYTIKEDILCYLILVKTCVFLLKKKFLTASLEKDSGENAHLTFNR